MKQEERNALVEANMGLAVFFAKNYQASHMDFDDLLQEAYLGLLDAAARFNPKHGTTFSTYAHWHIMKTVMRAIHTTNETIRTPRRRPSIICDSIDETPEVAEMADPKPNAEKLMDNEEMSAALHKCLKNLPHRDGIVLRLRYGVDTQKMTLGRVGAILGVTAERVRQIQNSAEEKLRALLLECAILDEQPRESA